MDPQACLESAWRAFTDGRMDVAREAYEDYRRWRLMGGFEPSIGHQSGDRSAEGLRIALLAESVYRGRGKS